MVDYVYDGSFEGLLTAVYEAYYMEKKPQAIIERTENMEPLLIERVHIMTDEIKADKVYRAIEEKISGDALEKVYYTFLSNDVNRGTYIYHYLRLGFKVGSKIEGMITNPTVMEVDKLSLRVKKEKHRMLGLLRFRLVDEASKLYYGPMSPDHNIVALLAPHFSDRMANQNWIIHDVGRGIAVLYNQDSWVVKNVPKEEIDSGVGEEELIQNLWRDYFKHISIENRRNDKLQKRNMPKRYWHYLTEKN